MRANIRNIRDNVSDFLGSSALSIADDGIEDENNAFMRTKNHDRSYY